MGASSSYIILPFGAMIAGFVTGCVTSFGYAYLQNLLKKIKIHDTCGILSCYFIPGFIGGIVSSIIASRTDGNFLH